MSPGCRIRHGRATWQLAAGLALLASGCGNEAGPSGPAPGAAWRKYEGNPVLLPGTPGSWEAGGVFAPCVLSLPDSSYAMWYTGTDSTTRQIGLATSPDGSTWTKYGGNPVFIPGAPGTWDALGVESPSVHLDAGQYLLFYGGRGATGRAIGMATSTDGIHWLRQAAPVLTPTPATPYWDDTEVYAPWVRASATGFEMWYTGTSVYRQVGYATSRDGEHWTKLLSPVIQAQVLEAVSFEPCVLRTGSLQRIWYGARHESTGGGVSPGVIDTAQSFDGVEWSSHRTELLPGPMGSWDADAVSAPSVLGAGQGQRMWYEGWRGLVPGDPTKGTSAIGMATFP